MGEGVPKVKSQEDLQQELNVRLSPGVYSNKLFAHIKMNEWVKFVVDKNHNISLDTDDHGIIARKLGINIVDLLSADGGFWLNPKSGKIDFHYNNLATIAKTPNLQPAVEYKIKDFLRSNSLEIK